MRAPRENITHSVRQRDPRWEPSEPPPSGEVRVVGETADPTGEPAAGAERAPLPPFSLAPAPDAEAKGEAKAEAPAGDEAPAPGGGPPKAAASTGNHPAAAPAGRAVLTLVDPRMAELEPLVGRGDWEGICARLGPADQAGKLPPTLGLLYAVARRESSGDESVGELNALAIRCAASLFGVPPESDTALVLAKRLLRKNPAAWRSRPAPPRNVSAVIMLLALVVGLGVGWWSSHGTLMLLFR